MRFKLSDITIEIDCSVKNILIPTQFKFEQNDDRNIALIGLSASQVPEELDCDLFGSHTAKISSLRIEGLEANCKVDGYPQIEVEAQVLGYHN